LALPCCSHLQVEGTVEGLHSDVFGNHACAIWAVVRVPAELSCAFTALARRCRVSGGTATQWRQPCTCHSAPPHSYWLAAVLCGGYSSQPQVQGHAVWGCSAVLVAHRPPTAMPASSPGCNAVWPGVGLPCHPAGAEHVGFVNARHVWWGKSAHAGVGSQGRLRVPLMVDQGAAQVWQGGGWLVVRP
jgi:hypothetical protein